MPRNTETTFLSAPPRSIMIPEPRTPIITCQLRPEMYGFRATTHVHSTLGVRGGGRRGDVDINDHGHAILWLTHGAVGAGNQHGEPSQPCGAQHLGPQSDDSICGGGPGD